MEETKNIKGKFEIDAILNSDYSSSDTNKVINTEEDELLQLYKKQQVDWDSEMNDNTKKQFDINKGFNLNQSF